MATSKKRNKNSVNIPSDGWPKINQGSHLTVKTFEDGRTELIWDDEALTRDVKNAILEYESTIGVESNKPKKERKKNVST